MKQKESEEIPRDIEMYADTYNTSRFWHKIKKVAKTAGCKVVYVALLLYYVLQDNSVPLSDKTKIIGALGYFILPIDLIPDALPVVGFGDDLAVLIWALNTVSSHITEETQKKAKEQLAKWFDTIDEAELENL